MQTFLDVFNLNLIISEHFDLQINLIDIHAEELICYSKTSTQIDEINDERAKIIKQIEYIRDFNLAKNSATFKQNVFDEKWHHVIDDTKLSYQAKLDCILGECIKPDCFLVKDANYIIQHCLWVTNWYNEREHVEFR